MSNQALYPHSGSHTHEWEPQTTWGVPLVPQPDLNPDTDLAYANGD